MFKRLFKNQWLYFALAVLLVFGVALYAARLSVTDSTGYQGFLDAETNFIELYADLAALSASGISYSVTAKTANYSAVATDMAGHFIFTNLGAAGAVDITLLAGTGNDKVGFYVAAAQKLQVSADGTETFQFQGTQSDAGGTVESSTIGCYWEIFWDGAQWIVSNVEGAITFDDTTPLGILLTSVELGAATDTTIARSGAGDLTIEGQQIHRLGGTDIVDADIADDLTIASTKVITGGVGTVTDADGFTMTALQGRGYVVYATGAGTIVMPPAVAGANFVVECHAAAAVVLNPDASGTEDTIRLDGTALAQGDSITSTSTLGDIAVCTYYAADTWSCLTNSWTDTN